MNRVFSSLVLSFLIGCAAALPACTADVIDEDEAQAPELTTEGIVVPQGPGKPSGGDALTADAGTK